MAQHRSAGGTYGTWRRPSRQRITSGLRSDRPLTALGERAAAYAAVLPSDAAFSHLTAAVLLGLPLPASVEAEAAVSLDVIRATDRGRIVRNGCRPHAGAEKRRLLQRGNVRVTDWADTWIDLGRYIVRPKLLTLADLVVAGDAASERIADAARLEAPGPLAGGVGITLLEARLRDRGRTWGRSALLEALPLLRPGVRSAMETLARLVIVGAGFPEPEVNARIHAPLDGHYLMEADLAWREFMVAAEYQGADHASIRRRSSDESRRAAAEDEGWTILEMYAADVYQGGRRRAFLRRLARHLGIPEQALRIDEPPPWSRPMRTGWAG